MLGPQVRDEARKTYKQNLKTAQGCRVLIPVPNFYQAEPLRVIQYGNMTAAEIPLDHRTRAKLADIDAYIQVAVDSPRYKPILNGERLLVNFSKWCKYVLLQPDGKHQPMHPDMVLDKGMYAVVIQASHVYVGPHKGGQTYSVALHIVELIYEPEQNLMDCIEDVMKTPPSSPPPTVSPPTPPRKVSPLKMAKRRNTKKKKGLDELVVHMSTM